MDKYLQYTPYELAEDESFIRWAKGNPKQGDMDWDSYLTEHPSKSKDIQSAKRIVKSIIFAEDPVSREKEDSLWTKINTNINTVKEEDKTASKEKTSILKLISIGAVAAIALVLLLMNTGSKYDTSIETSYATHKSIELPDGSTVVVNADSKLEYNRKSWNKDRLITLYGEAFFSVQKGSKFTVKTKRGDVSVLGTSFNINTRNDQLNVICKTGKVSVTNSQKETILTPNQAVTIKNNNHKFNKNIQDSEDRSSWKDGNYTYKDEVLSTVIGDLEREYDIQINIKNSLTKIKYSGGFNTSNLENSLSEVMWPLGLKFTIDGKNVLVNNE